MSLMRRFAKALLEQILPERAFVTIQSICSRNYQKRLLQRIGHADATSVFVKQFGCSVLHGPFAGMRYPVESILSRNGIPLLLGTYEFELHSILNTCVSRQYELVIDVGCAEGYYAVGLATRLKIPVHGFDTEFRERNYCRRMAVENGVSDLVHLYNWCSLARLRKLALSGRSLIICDCEGFEVKLFNEETIRDLRGSDLLIELHAVKGINVKHALCERLASSHDVQIIAYTGEGPQFQELESFGGEGPSYLRELRNDGLEWLWATGRT